VSINNIHFIFLFRNPDERYVYAIFAGDKCVYVGVGVEYRCLKHLNTVQQPPKPPGVDDCTYFELSGTPSAVVNRGWMLGSKLAIFVAFVKSNVANEVELALITQLKPLRNQVKIKNHRCGAEIAKHFKTPTFGSKLFCKVFTSNNELIII
jgi:hypothetical protein